jgi:hypothetical protein
MKLVFIVLHNSVAIISGGRDYGRRASVGLTFIVLWKELTAL